MRYSSADDEESLHRDEESLRGDEEFFVLGREITAQG
jgi:hypothetical protein